MHKVLTDEELSKHEPDFTLWATDRGLGPGDELFAIVRMLLLSGDDGRIKLKDYISYEAEKIRRRNG